MSQSWQAVSWSSNRQWAAEVAPSRPCMPQITMKGIINALRTAMSPFICGYITVRILISLDRFHYFYALCLYTVLQATGISVRMSANFSVHCYSHPILETEVTERCHVKSLLHVVFASSINNPFIFFFFFLFIFLDYLLI